eukprot:gene3748-biopygen3208
MGPVARIPNALHMGVHTNSCMVRMGPSRTPPDPHVTPAVVRRVPHGPTLIPNGTPLDPGEPNSWGILRLSMDIGVHREAGMVHFPVHVLPLLCRWVCMRIFYATT